MTRKTPPHSGHPHDTHSAKKPARRAPRTAAAPDKRNKAATAGAVRDPYANREAQRYARPIPSREAILGLLEQRGELLTEARIADALDIHDETDLEALRKRLAAMVRDGQLLLGRRGGYAPTQKLDLIAGVVLAKDRKSVV